MDSFRTEIKVAPKTPIDHRSVIVTAGSCFSDSIGAKLSENKFEVLVNPFGTSYNPLSIHRSLLAESPEANMFTSRDGSWFHFDFHSQFYDATRAALEEKLQEKIKATSAFINRDDVLLITYGTAWAYRHVATKQIVSNCHKQPGNLFKKELLSTQAIVEDFESFLQKLRTRRPSLKIILTLSPVRHTKDTLELNQVSKSVLRLAIHQVMERNQDVEYFPAYEIMLDDLRDYRFYATDMIHPSDLAIDYIWGKFTETYFNGGTKQLCERWERVRRALQHRPFHPKTDQYRTFLSSIAKDLDELKNSLNVSQEIAEVNRQLRAYDLA